MPQRGQSISQIMKDFEEIIVPGMTHWQHPNFHAYFSANSSTESILAEMLTAALGAQCMMWETSPAAAELEECVLGWLKNAMGLPRTWQGVIQDTASTATLCALITAREKATDFKSNDYGTPQNLRIYCSRETHSSIEKAAGVAGIGRKNVVKIEVDKKNRIQPNLLENAIKEDIENDLKPCAVVVTLGTTGTLAVDPLRAVASICRKYRVWCHVDAAYAGTALLLPEYDWLIDGVKNADSFVFNPHKWMFTNFDCTAYYVKDAQILIRSFEILPEYLKTGSAGQVKNYRDWGIQLGRRFRALKLWFVMRSYGLEGLRARLRHHIKLNKYLVDWIKKNSHLELVTTPEFNFCCFRYNPSNRECSNEELNEKNKLLLSRINDSGRAFISHTKLQQKYVLRCVIGQTYIEKQDVEDFMELLGECLEEL